MSTSPVVGTKSAHLLFFFKCRIKEKQKQCFDVRIKLYAYQEKKNWLPIRYLRNLHVSVGGVSALPTYHRDTKSKYWKAK